MKTMFEEKFRIMPEILLIEDEDKLPLKMRYEIFSKKKLAKKDESLFNKLLIEGLAAERKSLPAKEKLAIEDLEDQILHVEPEFVNPYVAGFASLGKLVANDDLRPVLKGIYCDNGYFVVTDGHAIVRVPCAKGDFYKEGAILGAKGEIEGKFPNYKMFLNPDCPLKTAPIEINSLLWTLRGMLRLYENVNRTLPSIPIMLGDARFTFNGELLFRVLRVMVSNGAKEVVFGFVNKESGGISIETDVTGVDGIIMLIIQGTEDLHFDVELSFPLAEN